VSLFNFLTLTSLTIIIDTCRRRAITFAYASRRARARICRYCTSRRKFMFTSPGVLIVMSRARPSQGLPVKRLPRAPILPAQVLSKHSGCAICKLHASPFCRLSSWLSDASGSHLNACPHGVYTISLTMFALTRRDMRHPLALWHRTLISNTRVAGRSSIDVCDVFLNLPNDYNSDISTDAMATSSSTRGRLSTTARCF
jgi:hypothetical protein